MTNNPPWWRRRSIAAAAAFILLAGGGALAGRWYLVQPAAAEASGTLVVDTNPHGVAVVIDHQPRGFTPVTLALAAGSHVMELIVDGKPRTIPLTITAGGHGVAIRRAAERRRTDRAVAGQYRALGGAPLRRRRAPRRGTAARRRTHPRHS